MVGIPAWVWRFGPVVRALIVGFGGGLVTGLLALFGSNSVPAGLVVLVVVTLVYGAVMARRTAKFWPGANNLSGPDRVAVVDVARSGNDIGDPRLRTRGAKGILAPGVIEYSDALLAARERRLYRWVIVLLGVVALGTAIADTITAPIREAVVSWLYFAIFPVELIWWPRRQAQLVANAERAAESARQLVAQ